MTKEAFIIEHQRLVREYEEQFRISVENLKLEYLKTNVQYKIGDFIYNVTGIIKVEKIECSISFFIGDPMIIYTGSRYWKKGVDLIKTKTTLKGSLTQGHDIKQVV